MSGKGTGAGCRATEKAAQLPFGEVVEWEGISGSWAVRGRWSRGSHALEAKHWGGRGGEREEEGEEEEEEGGCWRAQDG